ncbi:MAG: hypothetical protein KBS83_04025 [Lachnospiraceae bacterium]|nr:hypothetical protein [Candidatus Equihabitans merdae]
MFGYVVANQDELKIKDYKRYRSFYCGLCHVLKKKFGHRGQVTLSYDMVFLAILLNGLYEERLITEERRCGVHPTQKHPMVYNDITDYCADMEVMLAFCKADDNWRDEKDLKSRTFAGALSKYTKDISKRWPRQYQAIRQYIADLTKAEKEQMDDLDTVAGYTGKMLAELMVYKEDEWAAELRKLGFYLGKFIYLLDAREDLEQDLKHKNYNPWIPYMNRKDFDALVENTLTLMMGDCSRAFEMLPIVQDIEILRNIIYSGVWVKYRAFCRKEDAKGDKK